MAFPVVEATSTYSIATDTTSHGPISLPAGTAEDDLLLLWLTVDARALNTTLAGWNKAYDYEAALNVTSILFWKIAGASEPNPTITIAASEAGVAIVARISGHGSIVTGSAIGYYSGTSFDVQELVQNADAVDTLWVAFCGWDQGLRTLSTYPTGYSSNQVTVTGGASASTGAAMCTKNSAAASDNPDSFVISASDQALTLLVAINPPAAAGGGAARTKRMVIK